MQPCIARTPTVTYLGVSPPVRSGAANPWAHDSSWTRSVYSASHSNLQALRELDSTGESFLLAGCHAPGRLGASDGSMNVDAASLVLLSPDMLPGALSEAAAEGAAAEEAAATGDSWRARGRSAGVMRGAVHNAGVCSFGMRSSMGVVEDKEGEEEEPRDQEESLSDAGSESTAPAASPLPAGGSCPAAALRTLPAARTPPIASMRLRVSSPGAPAAPLPPLPVPLQQPQLQPLEAAAAPALKHAQESCSGAKHHVLEPFVCRTQYYV